MKIDILTLFPEMFEVPLGTSMMKKAQDVGAVEINVHNLRKWTKDKHKTVDGRPFGGGPGMVIKVDVVGKALSALKSKSLRAGESSPNQKVLRTGGQEPEAQITNDKQTPNRKHNTHTILLSPQGELFNQSKARELSMLDHIILIAGHYEGFDERIRKHLVDEEISIGEYILTGGEIPAMAVTDAVVRLLPRVLSPEAVKNESFSYYYHTTVCGSSKSRYDFPQYTKPRAFKGWKVPKILLSGNHAEIEKWRKKKAKEKSRQ